MGIGEDSVVLTRDIANVCLRVYNLVISIVYVIKMLYTIDMYYCSVSIKNKHLSVGFVDRVSSPQVCPDSETAPGFF